MPLIRRDCPSGGTDGTSRGLVPDRPSQPLCTSSPDPSSPAVSPPPSESARHCSAGSEATWVTSDRVTRTGQSIGTRLLRLRSSSATSRSATSVAVLAQVNVRARRGPFSRKADLKAGSDHSRAIDSANEASLRSCVTTAAFATTSLTAGFRKDHEGRTARQCLQRLQPKAFIE